MKIPLYKPWITDLEKEYVAKAVESGWVSSIGPFVDRFESAFAEYIGTSYATAVNSGTAACHLALLAAGIRPGDKVLVPNITFVASANAVRYCGATPVLMDIDPFTWNIDLNKVESLIDENVKAIMVVHLMGNPCDYNALIRLKKKYDLFIIEDACESLGAGVENNFAKNKFLRTGSWGDIGVFSFFGNKTITTGEGGMLTTNSEELDKKIKLYKGQGQTETYFHPVVGYNYRMTNVAAALGCAQLERIDEILTEKSRVYNRYALWSKNNHKQMGIMQEVKDKHKHGQWIFASRMQYSYRNYINDIFDTRPMFCPMHKLPLRAISNIDKHYPNSNTLHEYGLMLPSYPQLNNDEIDKICNYIVTQVKNEYSGLLG